MLGVQPESRERFSGDGFRLRDFIFVVRKREIDAAGVDIERLTQVSHRHYRTLDVPAWPSFADPFIPAWLALLLRLPQNEIASVRFIVFIHVHASSGAHAADIDVGQLAVRGKIRDAVVNRSFTHVGKPALAQLLDCDRHPVNVVGSLDQVFRPFQAKRGRVFEKSLRVNLGEFVDGFVRRRRVANDFVLDIGDIHHVIESVATGPQPPA